MHQQKGKKIFIYFFIFFLFSSINNIYFNKIDINEIKYINISGLDGVDNQKILNDIKNLKLKYIFLLDKKKIKKVLNANSLIEEYQIFKRYPSTLDINIKKTSFLAIINLNGKKSIIGSNGKLINYNFSNNHLPHIFGNPEIQEFLKIKKIIDDSQISYNEIKAYYYFKSKRWDLELRNKIVIKLSNDFTKQSLDNLKDFLNDLNLKNVRTLDARIKNQIIING